MDAEISKQINLLQFALFQTLGIFGHNQLVDATLNIAIHEGREVVDSVVSERLPQELTDKYDVNVSRKG